MSIYWMLVILIIVLGIVMPQRGPQRKNYVFLMTAIHTFVCAFRYEFLSGDLIKYNTIFRNLRNGGYFSELALNDWKNTAFYWLMKFIGDLSDGNYQLLLIVLAVITCVITGLVIYRYSPQPWLSFLVWNCLVFYIQYDMIAIKQGLAMALLLVAMTGILDKRPKRFLFFAFLAGCFHVPAWCFLPAYFIANRRLNGKMLIAYVAAAVVIYALKGPIVDFVGQLYYEDSSFSLVKEELGGRTIVIVIMLMAGLLLKGFREKQFSQLFNLVVVAAIFQMFSGFDNVFTRLADYYLQFTILYIPMIFYDCPDSSRNLHAAGPVLPFNYRSRQFFVACLVLVLIWWYDTTCLGTTIEYEVDNFLNFRFMWEVGRSGG